MISLDWRTFAGITLLALGSCTTEPTPQPTTEMCHAETPHVAVDYRCDMPPPATPEADEVLLGFYQGDTDAGDIRQLVVERYDSQVAPQEWASGRLGSLIAGAQPETATVSGLAAVRYFVRGDGVYSNVASAHYVVQSGESIFYVLLTVAHPDEETRELYMQQLGDMLASLSLV